MGGRLRDPLVGTLLATPLAAKSFDDPGLDPSGGSSAGAAPPKIIHTVLCRGRLGEEAAHRIVKRIVGE